MLLGRESFSFILTYFMLLIIYYSRCRKIFSDFIKGTSTPLCLHIRRTVYQPWLYNSSMLKHETVLPTWKLTTRKHLHQNKHKFPYVKAKLLTSDNVDSYITYFQHDSGTSIRKRKTSSRSIYYNIAISLGHLIIMYTHCCY